MKAAFRKVRQSAVLRTKQRIVSKAYQAIFPSITTLQIGTHSLPGDSSKAVVVVRVQPSHLAPHGVDGKRVVLRRVDSQAFAHGNSWNEKMGVDQVEWLVRRKQDGQQILGEAHQRRMAVLPDSRGSSDRYSFKILVAPLVPHPVPWSGADLRRVVALTTGFGNFPAGELRFIAGGMVSRAVPRSYYVDTTGLVAFSDTFQLEAPEVLNVRWLRMTAGVLQWAGLAARETGRGGGVEVNAYLLGVQGKYLELASGFNIAIAQTSLQENLYVRVESLTDDPRPCVGRILRRVSEGFAYELTDQELKWVIARRMPGPA